MPMESFPCEAKKTNRDSIIQDRKNQALPKGTVISTAWASQGRIGKISTWTISITPFGKNITYKRVFNHIASKIYT